MAITYTYEPQINLSGWPDDDGLALASWFDRDLTEPTITLIVLDAPMVTDADTFFAPKPLEFDVFAAPPDDADIFFQPTSLRALNQPDQMLRNEIRRVR